jgi:ParB-like chromosome segregation protein Spo0J
MNVATETTTVIWPIDRLIPYVRNPRKNDAAVERMAASIQEFGFKIPCLVRSSGEVVDGHLRLKARASLASPRYQLSFATNGPRRRLKHFA